MEATIQKRLNALPRLETPLNAIAEARRLRDYMTGVLEHDGRDAAAGQLFLVFADPELTRITAWLTPREAGTDGAAEKFAGWVPLGFFVSVDMTRPGDEDVTAFTTRQDRAFPDSQRADGLLAWAHLQLNASAEQQLRAVYEAAESMEMVH